MPPVSLNQDRRIFMKTTTAMAATTAMIQAKAYAAGSDVTRVGVIGIGSQGRHHLDRFLEIDGVEVTYVCDVDQQRLDQAHGKAKKSQAVTDLRKILEDPKVDAVSIGTPDHWHAPASILACETGKHVYVEKPCSHNFREGQLLVAAAEQHKRIVQHGTQQRSNPFTANMVQMLREGLIGEVLVARVWNIQKRADIGKTQPSKPPEGFDYDMWVGPAEMVPFRTNCHHYTWRWWHNFGDGDMGNDGVHELDYARWGLGVETFPNTITGIGGKYFFDDDQQFPDTQTVVFEFSQNEPASTSTVSSKKQLVFEMRLWSTNYPYNVDSGVEFLGTEGKLFVSKRGKLEVFDRRNRRVDRPAPKNPVQLAKADHYEDFIDAIRNQRTPNAPIKTGFYSTALCNLGNVATATGQTLRFDPDSQKLVGYESSDELLSRKYRDGHWAVPKGV